jgi:hypothetical protein
MAEAVERVREAKPYYPNGEIRTAEEIPISATRPK